MIKACSQILSKDRTDRAGNCEEGGIGKRDDPANDSPAGNGIIAKGSDSGSNISIAHGRGDIGQYGRNCDNKKCFPILPDGR